MTAPVSPQLQAFTSHFPWERGSILSFMQEVAAQLPAASRVLDVGAGEAPYRELFEHVEYLTSDWENSVHPGARRVDVVGSADALPVADEGFDAVIMTQVLEHVAEPARVLAELRRILRPGGRAFLTVPLVWELHEEPYDFYRYTPHSLRHLLLAAGFDEIDVRPRNDTFSTLAQLMRNVSEVIGRAPDGLDGQREQAVRFLAGMADSVAALAPLDTRWIFPLGYTASAVKPGGQAGSALRAAAGLLDARAVVVLSLADELIADPALLEAYARAVADDSSTTLAIYAPDADEAALLPGLERALSETGLDVHPTADLLLLPVPRSTEREAALGRCASALLSARPGEGAFADLPAFA